MRRFEWAPVRGLLSLIVILGIVTSAVAFPPPDGKGGGKGDGDEEPAPLPAGLDIRYRVNYIPIPEDHAGFFLQDVNDIGQMVGWFRLTDVDGTHDNIGFLYDSTTGELQSSDDMISSLDPVWTDVQFVGMNNLGAIVGRLTTADNTWAGILIYPDETSATGWAHEILPIPEEAAVSEYGAYARKINDQGDIVGLYYREDVTRGAFALNTGLYDPADTLPLTDFNLTIASDPRPVVSNARKGLLEVDGIGYWFDFGDAYTLYDADAGNDVDPVSLVQLPSADYDIDAGKQPSLSHDEQIAVTEIVLISQKKGGTYSHTPGVVWDGLLIWEGLADAQGLIVNSAEDLNFVGDVVGRNFGDGAWWLEHADWGYLDLESMLVFDDPVGDELSDMERWYLNSPDYIDMSDRMATTSFGIIIGNLTGDSSRLPFVLIPEVQP